MKTAQKQRSSTSRDRGTERTPPSAGSRSIWRRYSFAWVTGAFFLLSLAGHFLFSWFAFVNEQTEHGAPVRFGEYAVVVARDTLENWQSEFLQLIWQVAGLAMFLYIGSPQSKEGDDRVEAKIDELLRRIDPSHAERVIAALDEEYGGRHTDERYQRLRAEEMADRQR